MSGPSTPDPFLPRGEAKENAEIVAVAIEALTARDAETVETLFDDEVEWRPALGPGGAVGGKLYRGKQAMFEYMADVDAGLEDVQVDIEQIDSVKPDRVLYRVRVTATVSADGIPLDLPVWAVWQVRDGKLVRGAAFLTEADALEAAGLSE